MSAINVCITNAAKKQLVSLPRDMTIADLQKLAPRQAALTVCGCTPSGATTLGDLYDVCATEAVLEVVCVDSETMGTTVCGPCCLYHNPEPSNNGNSTIVVGSDGSVSIIR